MLPRRFDQENVLKDTEKLTKEEIIKNAREWILDGCDSLKEDLETNDFFNIMGTLEEMLYYANSADTVIRVLKE